MITPTYTLTLELNGKSRRVGLDRHMVYTIVRDCLTDYIPQGKYFNFSSKLTVKDILTKIQTNFDKGKHTQYYGGFCPNIMNGNNFPSVHISKE